MRAAGVLDCLGREEKVLWGGFVVGSVDGGFGGCGRLVAEVFKEKDYAIDGAFFFLVFHVSYGVEGGLGLRWGGMQP